TINVVVQVTTSAQTGKITYSAGALTDNVTIEVAGSTGSVQIVFASGTTVRSSATAINAVTTATGVSAAVSGADLVVNSTKFGSDQFVSLKTVSGTFTPDTTKDSGQDASITINGAEAQADGLAV